MALDYGSTAKFEYTGTVQCLPVDIGVYRIECHGAKGGGLRGHNGDIVSAVFVISEPSVLFIHVGNEPDGQDGGWNGGESGKEPGFYGGGGASGVSLAHDFAEGDTKWDSQLYRDYLLIQACGGEGQGSIGNDSFVPNADVYVYKDKVYFVPNKSMTWFQARDYCYSIGACLACPKTKEYVDFCSEIAMKYSAGAIWLGGSDAAKEGDWRWIIDNSKIEYTKWNSGEPNNSGNEDCLQVYPNSGLWNDLNGTQSYPFICEMTEEAGGGGGMPSYINPNDSLEHMVKNYEGDTNGYILVTNMQDGRVNTNIYKRIYPKPVFDMEIINQIIGSSPSYKNQVKQTAHGFSEGQFIYKDESGQFHLACADNTATATVHGMVSKVISDDEFVYMTSGKYPWRNLYWQETVIMYLSDKVPGGTDYYMNINSGIYTPVAVFAGDCILIMPQQSSNGIPIRDYDNPDIVFDAYSGLELNEIVAQVKESYKEKF